MHDERRAIERQLVLTTDTVEVSDWKACLQSAGADNLLTLNVLIELVGAAVGHQQHFRTGVGEMRADDLLPDILADRDADLHAFEL